MSSARMLAAAVALGLAACAHTPSHESDLHLPDISRVAPVRLVASNDVPAGYDEHIVILLDRDAITQAYSSPYSLASRHSYGLVGAAYRRPQRPTTTTSATTTTPRPAASSQPATGAKSTPGRSRQTTRNSRR